MAKRLLSSVTLALLATSVCAETITIPFGTTVFCELEERVTSKKKETSKGDLVRAHVWRDVWVGEHLVIEAGTPVYVRVSDVRKAKIAGRKGMIELEALNVTAANGRDIPLDGGYDRSGRGKMGLSIALAAIVAWPLIFLKGKQAVLEPGTIFDAIVPTAMDIVVDERTEARAPTITLPPDLAVTIPYDEIDPEGKLVELPLDLEVLDGEISEAAVTSVNGKKISPLPIRLENRNDDLDTYRGGVEFKPLSKHFTRGMNRLGVTAGEFTAEVLLEIEL